MITEDNAARAIARARTAMVGLIETEKRAAWWSGWAYGALTGVALAYLSLWLRWLTW